MSSPVIVPKRTSIDLQLNGSLGEFKISSPNNGSSSSSVDVKYLLTHVNISTKGDHNERLVKNLVPVREIWDYDDLGFEQIMQRDIDDARVSSELIEYIIEQSNTGLVKLFPPIVVTLVPTNGNNPIDFYPICKTTEETRNEFSYKIQRSGEIGQECFEFEQLIVAGKADPHNYVSLGINTQNCRLVIVDGQHRAMALLALYRNLTSWEGKTEKYKRFYERWSRDYISEFDFSNLNLPVMICTFPELHEGSEGMTVTKASRNIFLALNKNARRVSVARNRLLDDRDLISHFMRTTLSKIKNQGARSELHLRISNFELDNTQDKVRLQSPLSISGIMHLYPLIERLLIAKLKWTGIKSTSDKLGKRIDVAELLNRLDADQILGEHETSNIKRNEYSKHQLEQLTKKFEEFYLSYIIKILNDFYPYNIHCKTSLDFYERTKADSVSVHSMLYEGQNISTIYEEYRAHIKSQLEEQEKLNKPNPALSSSVKSFDGIDRAFRQTVNEFRNERGRNYFHGFDPKLHKEILDNLYENTFTTSAFHSALILTFFSTMEILQEDICLKSIETRLDEFCVEYINSINKFFDCGSKKIINLCETFYKFAKISDSEIDLIDSSKTLRHILIPGELNPSEWTKFRYILLELWKSDDSELNTKICELRDSCRKQALTAYIKNTKESEAKDQGVSLEDLDKKRVEEINNECIEDYKVALKKLGAHNVNNGSMQALLN